MSTGTTTDEPTMRERRQSERNRLYKEQKGIQLFRAAVVGAVAGLLAVLYQASFLWVQAWSRGYASHIKGLSIPAEILFVAFTGAVGAVASYFIGRYAPESGGSGIPHVKAALLHMRQVRPAPLIVAKFLGGLAAIAAGMSFGREGPTIQMGAAAGKIVSDFMKVPHRSRNSLLAAGAGAGLAAAFNAPLAGFLFVMEELKREMSAVTYGSALIASVCAVAVTQLCLGQHPSFRLTSPGGAPLSVLPQVALLGLIAGLGGVLFNKSLLFALDIRSRFKIRRWQYGLVVGILSGVALLYCPSITGGGHSLAESILTGNVQASDLLLTACLIFTGKLLLTAASYGTGLPGGIFAPILVLGSVMGMAYGLIVHKIAPGTAFSAAGFATVGMASLLAGSVRAPLTGVVLIVEMTAEYGLLYALLVAVFIADLVAEGLKDMPIYEALMERDLRVSGAELHANDEPFLLEVLIEPGSAMDGVRVRNLRFPPGAILATLQRGSTHVVPGGNTVLHAGDMVTMMVESDKPDLNMTIHHAAKAP